MEVYRNTYDILERRIDASKSTGEERQASIVVKLAGFTKAEKNLIEDHFEAFYDEVDRITSSVADHIQQ